MPINNTESVETEEKRCKIENRLIERNIQRVDVTQLERLKQQKILEKKFEEIPVITKRIDFLKNQ